jgi:imidazolonepropionase-like amidohydrolase
MTAENPLLLTNATIINGVDERPVGEGAIWIEGGRIKAVGRRDDFSTPSQCRVIDARGKYVIPGLMNANVHLLGDTRLENLLLHDGRYEDLIVEAAQVALKSGLTTVFDTWGPRAPLIAVRDAIRSGRTTGSRIFCAGNILGFDGPLSTDFFTKDAEVASSTVARRINSIWVENVGRHLMWRTPERVATEVRAYIGRGIDFIKYASNDHYPGAFLAFSPQVQAIMVGEAHAAGITAQAHTMSVEGLRIAVEAGCDLIQHANITGPTEIPDTTVDLIVERGTGAVVFPWTRRALSWIMEHTEDLGRTMWQASDANVHKLIRAGATLLLANDATIFSTDLTTDPFFSKTQWGLPGEDSLISLSTGHFAWLKAMEEKGCPPMEMLRAATRNIARAYGKADDLGTIEVGKIADMLILDKDPLQSAENYRSIHNVIKEGAVVNTEALPVNPLLTGPAAPAVEQESSFVPFLTAGKYPACPMCMRH